MKAGLSALGVPDLEREIRDRTRWLAELPTEGAEGARRRLEEDIKDFEGELERRRALASEGTPPAE
jgi:hypothetical protein